jgi:autotransporter-associated beta strand protein
VGTVTLESNSVLNLNGVSDTIGSLAGFGQVKLGGVAATRLTVSDGQDSVFAGTISGTGGLIRAGAGSLTLTGSNAWTGPSIVTGGLLRVDGELASSSAATVYSNAFLGGTGTLRCAVTVQAGGGFDWRSAPGTLTIVTTGACVLGAGAIFRYRFNASTGSCVTVQGTLNLPSTAVVETLPAAGFGPRSFDAVLMRADILTGAATLGGWVVRGGRGCTVSRTATEVILHYRSLGANITLR